MCRLAQTLEEGPPGVPGFAVADGERHGRPSPSSRSNSIGEQVSLGLNKGEFLVAAFAADAINLPAAVRASRCKAAAASGGGGDPSANETPPGDARTASATTREPRRCLPASLPACKA